MTDDGLLKLRDEIQIFEKAAFELQKWKLITIGAALTVGLGLSKEAGSGSVLALFAVPFLAAYSDLVVRDYDLRIALLARFIRSRGGVLAEYENFLHQDLSALQLNPWILANVATSISSYAANSTVALLSVYYAWSSGWPLYRAVPFVVIALSGGIATYLIKRSFQTRLNAIHKLDLGNTGEHPDLRKRTANIK